MHSEQGSPVQAGQGCCQRVSSGSAGPPVYDITRPQLETLLNMRVTLTAIARSGILGTRCRRTLYNHCQQLGIDLPNQRYSNISGIATSANQPYSKQWRTSIENSQIVVQRKWEPPVKRVWENRPVSCRSPCNYYSLLFLFLLQIGVKSEASPPVQALRLYLSKLNPNQHALYQQIICTQITYESTDLLILPRAIQNYLREFHYRAWCDDSWTVKNKWFCTLQFYWKPL